ncbi:MAG: glycosyltransferase [Lachnospiraceae bacterium]|nr:glycosyltransferase [Lachnospiraceae bacterium]
MKTSRGSGQGDGGKGMGMDKLKVLQLGKQYYPHIGGVEATMQQIAEGIQGEVDSYVLASQGRGAAYEKTINGVPVYFAKSLGIIASLPISWDLVRYLKKHCEEYDVIHLHMPFPLGDLACFLSGYKGKLVLYWHSDVVRQKKAMLFYKPLMKWTLKRADAIAIATQGNIDGSPYVKPFEEKCVRIPFGLRKAWEEKSDKYWERRTEREDSTLRLLFIGRLVYYKGCSILMAAMRELKKELGAKMDQIELAIVGTGVLEEEMKAQAAREGLGNVIRFLGKASDEEMEKELERCDVLVFPSVANSEAFGLVQLEAMSYGKPVINTSLPTGVPWVSLDKETGLTVPPEDAESLFRAILWMKDHPEERKEMGIRARRRVKEKFSQEQMLGQILELYKELCGQ